MTSRNRNRGSANFSRLGLKSNCSSNRSVKPEKISKYLAAEHTSLKSTDTVIISDEEDSYQAEYIESPYKDSVIELKNFALNSSLNDENDFKSPKRSIKPCAKKKLILNLNKKLGRNSHKKPKDRKKSRQTILETRQDVNTEHLQLAIALSKSIQDNNIGDDANEDMDDLVSNSIYPSTQQKIATVKSTLEQFGFKYDGNKMKVENRRLFTQQKKKKSKFRYVTPALLLRTQEAREKIISEKISLILSENSQEKLTYTLDNYSCELQPSSEKLKSLWKENCNIFPKNRYTGEEVNSCNLFYVASLGITPTKTKCGILLKNWNEIPGRDTSPERTLKTRCISPKTNIAINALQDSSNLFKNCTTVSPKRTMCTSPELFCSDNEGQSDEPIDSLQVQISHDRKELFSQSLLDLTSPKKLNSTMNHVLHFDCRVSDHLEKKSIDASNSEEVDALIIEDSFCSMDDNKNENSLIKSKFKVFNSSEKFLGSDNGIVVFEDFNEDVDFNVECIDLTHYSDEEHNVASNGNTNTVIENSILSDSDSVRKSENLNILHVSKAMEKSHSVCDISNTSNKSVRRSKSLNITDYIKNMLDDFDATPYHCSSPKILENEVEKSVSHHSNLESKAIPQHNSNKSFTLSPQKVELQKQDSFISSASSNYIRLSQSSEDSASVNDEELNYSSNFTTSTKKNSYFYELVNDDLEIQNFSTENNKKNPECTPKIWKFISKSSGTLNAKSQLKLRSKSFDVTKSKLLFDNVKMLDDSFNSMFEDSNLMPNNRNISSVPTNSDVQNSKQDIVTPKREVIIRTTNITPMSDYNEMSSPQIIKELQQFGLKPLKRKRGIQILKHIYEATHPLVDHTKQIDDQIVKKRKNNSDSKLKTKNHDNKSKGKTPSTSESLQPEMEILINKTLFDKNEGKIEIVGDLMSSSETPDDLTFERKQSSKILSCRLPLHIAWHNLVSSQPILRKLILLYEPLHLEVLDQYLKDQGFKFHVQDLLTFLDKKCITIRTNQNQRHNKPKSVALND